ncbi:hypothetical protein CK203_116819 [Vitis vinifera]|uniref:Uncharacterized protein n=1 Tax=Vitis vinifera TaxID=29760 RepID=A0A438CS98_VITVI|nr:hypothetical protein CK203_116819 [Vitis vinifera]
MPEEGENNSEAWVRVASHESDDDWQEREGVAMGEEVGGEASTRTSERVKEAMEGSRLEASATDCRWDVGSVQRVGQITDLTWSDDGLPAGGWWISRIDCALLEEDAGTITPFPPLEWWLLTLFFPLFSFGRTPLGESFDPSGALLDTTQGDIHRLCNGSRSTEQVEGSVGIGRD